MATAEPDSTVISAEQIADPDLNAKIIKQVEFYFGDKNLPRDKFLLRILHEEGNEVGWVPLSTLLDFNRLKKLTTDTLLMATALKQSNSGLLEVSEDNTKIRRVIPIPEVNENVLFDPAKTIYAKGFPTETTIDELEIFFESFGKIAFIKKRTALDKTFKGSVFIEFTEESNATEFVKKDAIKYKETELISMMKNAYLESKALQRQEYKKNARLEKSKILREKIQNDTPFLKGALLKLEGFPNTTKREEIKKIFPQNSVKFIDMQIGDISCVVMFLAENGALDSTNILQTEENTLKFGETMLKYTILVGENEQNEWVRLSQYINDNFGKHKRSNRNMRGGQSSRRGGFRGRGRGRDSRKFQGWRDKRDDKVNLGKRKGHEDNVKTDDTEESQPKHIRMGDSDED